MIKRENLGLSTSYEPPNGEQERLITELFAKVFDIDRIGANDDFFDVGGDSLLAETLSIVISERTGIDFQISALVEHGTPRRIAALLGGPSETAIATPATVEGARPPIFIVHGRNGFTLPKPAFRQGFAEGQQFYIFELPGIRGGRSYDRIEDIAAVYVAQLLGRYPQGPIFLSSFCMGGLIALEMAYQLAKLGRPVCKLVLLDPALPKAPVVNPKREIKRNARLAYGSKTGPSPRWIRGQLLLHRLRKLTYSITRRNADFADDELRSRNILLKKKQEGRSKYEEEQLSIEAQTKLHAAFRHYRPRSFSGLVDILSARERDPTFRDPSHQWNELLPQRRVQLVAEEHDDIGGGPAARLMQSIFDTALAELGAQAGKTPSSAAPNSPDRPRHYAGLSPRP